MSVSRETITVPDKHDFRYEVELEHCPAQGYTLAKYRGSIIASCELGRMREPMSDNDREWEMYEERFAEWKDAIKTNIIPMCREHFNNQS